MIHVTGETNWETLVDQVRHVSLLQPRDGELIYPYQNADISLQEISYTDVRPTSLYALRGNLAFQQALSEALAPDHDPLLLNGALQLANDEGSPMGLLPPIVEYTDERGKYILDGLHRTFMGYRAGRTAFNAIYIRNFRDDCPASALPNEWDEVREHDTVPKDPALKRRYIPNAPAFRRDFSALNGSQPRV